ncbi:MULTISPECIES: HNH endonuclease signature motif containing protein [unclassified Nocardia]|uniref:HNH endonuclease signature motif containing protein n=1 Tax=unclassified Nocardia TaxID=2637762 RepID=UPI00278C32C0|nr:MULTISPECIES: HNH endonuclease signature motif containing protein [unclassified Nocardia]
MSDPAEVEPTSYELVARLQAVHAHIAAAQAEEVALMTRLYRLRRTQQLEAGVAARYAGESAATEIGVAVRVSQRSADGLIALGMGLQRLPATRRAFAQGRIDLARVRAIHDTLVNVPDETVPQLEDTVVARAERCDPVRLRRTIRRKLLEIDPAGQTRRRQEAERERYVAVRAADDGTAVVDAVLPAAGGWTLFERLREMAITQCCTADPRTMNQRRADALVALADGSGQLTCGCDLPDCSRRDPDHPVPTARRALVQVGVSAATLLEVQDNPALLAGFGAIDADLARQIACHARFHVIPETASETIDDNLPSTAIDRADGGPSASDRHADSSSPTATPLPSPTESPELRYRPSASLAARVRALDGICRAPGCHAPAAVTDLDHQQPFDHRSPDSGGPTTEQNLGCRCRRHHRLKTLADHGLNGWTVTHHPHRRIEWRTPTGDTITTNPEGANFLFPHIPIPAMPVKPVDPQPAPPLLDPGPVINTLTELLHVYIPPGRRNLRAHHDSHRVVVGNTMCGMGGTAGGTERPPF